MSISLVIPAYNEQSVIGDCLSHALDQDPPFDEIIVVNNASTDRTAEVVQDYVDRYRHIRMVDEPRRGLAAARRTGFDAASGGIIGRVDADTRMSPGWSRAVIDALDDGRWAAVTGVLMFYDAPLQDQMRAAYLWTMAVQGKRAGGRLAALVGSSMAIRADAWSRIRDSMDDRPGTHEDQVISQELRHFDQPIYFAPEMEAQTSPRRALISPISNANGLRAGIVTAWAAGRHADAVVRILAVPFNLAFLTALWLIVRPWDPVTHSWKPTRLLHPMATRESAVT